MNMILAILLWLGCIQAPNTYTVQSIDAYAQQHQTVITDVLGNQPQQDVIWSQYGVVVGEVNVIDPYK